MKKLIVLILLALTSQVVSAQTDVFDKLVNRFKSKGWVKMNLNGDFDFLKDINKNVSAEINGTKLDFDRILSKQKSLRLVVLDSKAALQNADFQSLVGDFKKEGYEDLMVVRKGKDRVHFMGQERNNRFDDLTMVIKSEDGGAVLMSFKGNYSRKDVDAILEGK